MRIDALRPYQRKRHTGRFAELPRHLQIRAEELLQQFLARRGGRVPRWLFGILCGQAKRLASHPPDAAWGRWMAAKRGGYAVQRRYRALGRNPTAKARRVRAGKRKPKEMPQRPTPPRPPVRSSDTRFAAPFTNQPQSLSEHA